MVVGGLFSLSDSADRLFVFLPFEQLIRISKDIVRGMYGKLFILMISGASLT
jgi:hypothetical protein